MDLPYEVIQDLKNVNKQAGEFQEIIYKEEAKQVFSNGYDAVVFYGEDLVERIPEVVVFSNNQVQILDVEMQ